MLKIVYREICTKLNMERDSENHEISLLDRQQDRSRFVKTGSLNQEASVSPGTQ
ncbi:hypothetical protein BgiBS90_009583, partial [Biomphalaria glabrata]